MVELSFYNLGNAIPAQLASLTPGTDLQRLYCFHLTSSHQRLPLKSRGSV